MLRKCIDTEIYDSAVLCGRVGKSWRIQSAKMEGNLAQGAKTHGGGMAKAP